MRLTLLLGLILAAGTAFAVGSDDPAPPKPTPTSETCENGQIWSEKDKACVDPDSSSLDDDLRMDAVRELAHASDLDGAARVLAAMTDQTDPMVSTYRGFIARKSGDWDGARVWYATALAADPDNLLARSYLGQGLAARGDLAAARAQLREIRMRGGRGTWPEFALRLSLERGGGNY